MTVMSISIDNMNEESRWYQRSSITSVDNGLTCCVCN